MSDWPSADRNTHLKIVSVALVASSIFVVIGQTAQTDNAATKPGDDRHETRSVHLLRSVDSNSSPTARAPARPIVSRPVVIPNT
jgi:hypothetical protein